MKTTRQYRYEFRRNGKTILGRWTDDHDTAMDRMARRIGPFHRPGIVAGDGDRYPDGSHPGVARNGGGLALSTRDL